MIARATGLEASRILKNSLGYPWLEIKCSRCQTPRDVNLCALRHVPKTCAKISRCPLLSACMTHRIGGGSSNITLPRADHDLHVFQRQTADFNALDLWNAVMPATKERACTIIGELEQAQTELVGKAAILTDGKDSIWLDEIHGLRISIRCYEGKWPVSTIQIRSDGLR